MQNQTSVYTKTKVGTASPAQLILILYDELIKNLTLATDFIRKKQIEDSHLKLLKAQQIVGELAASLNLETGEIAKNLLRLYQYMMDELIQVNAYKDEARLNAILEMVLNLRKAWWSGVVLAVQK